MSRPATWTPGPAREILDTFARLNSERGLTVVMITHDRQVAKYASRSVELRDGRILDESNGAGPSD